MRADTRSRRSRGRAIPRRRKRGDSDAPSQFPYARKESPPAEPERAKGIDPTCTVPSRPAKAQCRSLTMTAPFGQAIPPSRGAPQHLLLVGVLRRLAEVAPLKPATTYSARTRKPPGVRRAVSAKRAAANLWLAAEEPEQEQDEDDDQDDPENTHAVSTPFRRCLGSYARRPAQANSCAWSSSCSAAKLLHNRRAGGGSSEDDLPLRLNPARYADDRRGLNPSPVEHGPAGLETVSPWRAARQFGAPTRRAPAPAAQVRWK